MDINITVAEREIKPSVVNLYQFENETTTLEFTLDSYVFEEIDLRNYKCYVVTSQNGQIDMTEVPTMVVDSKLIVTWEVQEYSIRQRGAVLYQLCFKENADDGENTAVWYSYKGVIINRESIDADNHITANYPTILKQWLDRINENRDELITEIHTIVEQVPYGVVYIPYGETLDPSVRTEGHLYYQITSEDTTEGHFEDHQGNKLGLSGYVKVINDAVDLNTLVENHTYAINGAPTNAPTGATIKFVQVITDGTVVTQIAYSNYTTPTNVWVRVGTVDGQFPEWSRLVTNSDNEFLQIKLDKKQFEIDALYKFHSNEFLHLVVDTFDDTTGFQSIPDTCVYDTERKLITSSGDCELSYNSFDTSTYSSIWVSVDYEGGSVEIVLDETSLTNNEINAIIGNSQSTLTLKIIGEVTLKNVAWGLK